MIGQRVPASVSRKKRGVANDWQLINDDTQHNFASGKSPSNGGIFMKFQVIAATASWDIASAKFWLHGESYYRLHERFDCRLGAYLEVAVCSSNMLSVSIVALELKRPDHDLLRQHQADIRKDYLSSIYDAISRDDREGYEIGSRIILPTSFTGGPRYMYSHYLDVLAIGRVLGNPQYFITFTWNVNWLEIKRHMEEYPGLLPGDRANIVVRVFQQELMDFCNYLTSSKTLLGPWSMLIKYLFKYISKGTDKIVAQITKLVGESDENVGRPEIHVDEIQNFVDGRFICPHEAWYKDSKSWQPRRKKGQGSIGRLVYVHPNLACDALGLLGDDKEWDTTMKEACFSSTPSQLRSLFAQILIFCDMADPLKLWKSYWLHMSDDIPRTTATQLHIPDLYMNNPELEGSVLYELQAILNSFSRSVIDFGLPPLSDRLLKQLKNKEMMEEKNQRKIYDLIVDGDAAKSKELYLGKIVLLVASSSIASLLLPSGRTAHSRKVHPKLEIVSFFAIAKSDHPLWHHFTNVLHSLPQYAGYASLPPPPITASAEQNTYHPRFAAWLLDIGNGSIREPDTNDPQNSSWIHILERYSITDDEYGVSKLIDFIYDKHTLKIQPHSKSYSKNHFFVLNVTADSSLCASNS
ncbi:DNA helicase [Tanacetum coccineum]